MSAYTPINSRSHSADPDDLAAAVTYARTVADSYVATLSQIGMRPAGARVLEIGPGHACGAAALMACRGARVTAADRYPPVWDDAYHPAFCEALLNDVGSSHPDEDPRPIRRMIAARSFAAAFASVAAGAESLSSIEDASFDIVLSTAVLEHVEHVPRALSHLSRITRPGGVGVHQIDFRDHRNFDRPLEYLSLEANGFWAMFGWCCGDMGNRWRHTSMADVFVRAGFDILRLQPNLFAAPAYVSDIRARLHPDFASVSDEELSVLSACVVCRRSTRAPAAESFSRPGLIPPSTPGPVPADHIREERIVIFGAGAAGDAALAILEHLGRADRVVAVCDGSPAKHGRTLGAHTVVQFEALAPTGYDLVLVASDAGREAIGRQLSATGLIQEPRLQAFGFVDAYVHGLSADHALA